MLNFNQKLTDIFYLSRETTQGFMQLNIETIKDLIFYLPHRYEDRYSIYKISDLIIDKQCLFYGRVIDIEIKNKILSVSIIDNSGFICKLVYFHFTNFILNQFKLDREGFFYGKIAKDIYGDFSVYHPDIEWIKKENFTKQPYLDAVYYTCKKLPLRELRLIMASLLKKLNLVEEKDYLTKLGFYSLKQALEIIHQPKIETQTKEFIAARERLAMEEILNHAHKMRILRAKIAGETFAQMQKNPPLVKKFFKNLPFELTVAQKRVIDEITADLEKNSAMMRLIQGDVGCGKTVVALSAAIMAIANGYQVAFLTPTELLAQQHGKNIIDLLGNLGIKVEILTAQIKTAEKNKIIKALANGEIDLIIGTHSLFQEKITYHNLGLIIIDEQHRFGVGQRMAMLKKSEKEGKFAHQLYLTATPIPRTLQLADYGDLNYSKIDELPKGRLAVKTVKIENSERTKLLERVKLQCLKGKQVFWVCPYISESEKFDDNQTWKNAKNTAENLQNLLPELKIGLIHGKTKSEEKEEIIKNFREKKIHILVATTIIEVGVDIPNATIMIVENAEKFGLAQLHQLRGRVGRNKEQSFCVLLYQEPLEDLALKRINIMRESNNGFLIAEEDLNLRGSGEILGARQSGKTEFLLADLGRDKDLFITANKEIKAILAKEKNFLTALKNRWGSLEDEVLQG